MGRPYIDELRFPGIYQIRNTTNGKIYIGSASEIRRRRHDHFNELRANKHKNAHLQSAWNKYGAAAFVFEVLLRVDDKKALYEVEQAYLQAACSFDPSVGYNRASNTLAPQRGLKRSAETCARIGATKVGNKNRLGIGFSDESKARISASLTGIRASEETKKKLSAVRKGKKKSPEWCRKMSAIMKGRSVSKEARAKISATLTGRAMPEDVRRRVSEGLKVAYANGTMGKRHSTPNEMFVAVIHPPGG